MNPGPMCPADQHCADWARRHMSYCLCSVNDGVVLSLGMISVMCWGFAEVPQIITNYKLKLNEGISIAFLSTWIVGDLFNLFGCILEPATLPSQYYVAWLYTINTMILFGQTIYYRYIYPWLKSKQQLFKPIPAAGSHKSPSVSETTDQGYIASSPIPLPDHPTDSLTGQGPYYASARSLSSSHPPMAGSSPCMSSSPRSGATEPLLPTGASTVSTTPPKGKYMFSLLAGITIFGTSSLHHAGKGRNKMGMVSRNLDGIAKSVGRKLLQETHVSSWWNDAIGTSLGWGMAVIYMGGRLPQILLNIQRGEVEGLNPKMFLFAIVGNITYVASILLKSVQWSQVRPNMPWLVDAGGCILLDIFLSSSSTTSNGENKVWRSSQEGPWASNRSWTRKRVPASSRRKLPRLAMD
ncbi:hypothetical protein MLD38_007646 [Melastoma candidum]|uniref:Uncharacterized protein n=1 Tax=Melastoma candidum TaxID=119954 RepID=A0ACB9RR93_9MYRT|nr:hypothetical protein MLD38_007646 [Melastoma candidum]